MDLKPRSAEKLFEGEGGEYYSWSSKEFPLLSESKVGGGRLVLRPGGFALPHYADCAKIGYVLQGNDGVVGMVFPNTKKEVVVKLRAGDIIPVPLGVLSWWFNEGDSELIIVFLGKTNDAHIPGEFTYFLLTGGRGILASFSNDFISRAYGLTKDEADKLANSQGGVLIIPLPKHQTLPKPDQAGRHLVYNIDAAVPDHKVQNRGSWTSVTGAKFPFIGKVGLSANHVKLGVDSVSSLIYTTDSSTQMIYVVKGDGRIQIVGINGERVLDSEVKVGDLVVVPRFFVVAVMAGGEGIECLSVITSSEPVLEDIASSESTLAALSPETLQSSLNITPDFADLLISKIRKNSCIIP